MENISTFTGSQLMKIRKYSIHQLQRFSRQPIGVSKKPHTLVVYHLLGNLRSYDGCCNENVTLKQNFALGYVFCDYSMLITLYKTGELHFRLRGGNGFHVKAKSERFTAGSSRCCQNLKYENFTQAFGRVSQNIATKSVPHVQHDQFSSFNQSNH